MLHDIRVAFLNCAFYLVFAHSRQVKFLFAQCSIDMRCVLTKTTIVYVRTSCVCTRMRGFLSLFRMVEVRNVAAMQIEAQGAGAPEAEALSISHMNNQMNEHMGNNTCGATAPLHQHKRIFALKRCWLVFNKRSSCVSVLLICCVISSFSSVHSASVLAFEIMSSDKRWFRARGDALAELLAAQQKDAEDLWLRWSRMQREIVLTQNEMARPADEGPLDNDVVVSPTTTTTTSSAPSSSVEPRPQAFFL